MDWSGTRRRGLKLFLADRAESVAAQVRGWAAASSDPCSVETFHSSHQLLRHMDYERPDLVLLDLTMPHMDGLTTLRALAPTGVPAVMLSNHTLEGARAAIEALIAGASDCLLKTRLREAERIAISPQEFFRRIRRVLLGAEAPGERPVWRSIEIDDHGQVVAGAPSLDPFPKDGPWTGLALSPPRCVGRMIRVLAAAPERPVGGMLLGVGLPPKFTRGLAEAAARHWNRVVLEQHDGEQLRPGQWRVVPGRHLAAFGGSLREAPRVALLPGRRLDPGEALLRQIDLFSLSLPEKARLYLFEQPEPRSREALERLLSSGGSVLLQGKGAAVLKFERDEQGARPGERRGDRLERRVA